MSRCALLGPRGHVRCGVFQVGLLDLELNQLTKALFVALVALSIVMVTLQGFVGPWYRNLFRFLLLFSYIIPIR